MLDTLRLTTYERKISMLEQQIAMRQADYDLNINKQNQLLEQSNIAKQEIESLQAKNQAKKNEWSSLQLNIAELNARNTSLEKEIGNIFYKSQILLQQRSEIQDKLTILNTQINELELKKSPILYSLSQYDAIIRQPAPQPIYKIDGEYCINGIYMCKNHPPRQIVTNQEDIDRHQRAVDEAWRITARLKEELMQLDNAQNEIQQQYNNQMQYLESLNDEYGTLEALLESNRQELMKNKERLNEMNTNASVLLQEMNALDYQLTGVNATADNTTAQLLLIQSQCSDIQSNLERMKNELVIEIRNRDLELQRLSDTSNRMNNSLQKFARQELMLEELARQELMLEELARQELLKEQTLQAGAPQRMLASNSADIYVESDEQITGSAAEAAQPNSIFDRIKAGATKVTQDIKDVGRNTREVVSDAVTSVGDISPGSVNAIMLFKMEVGNRVNEEFFNETNTHTGSPMLDYLTKKRQENQQRQQDEEAQQRKP